MRFALRVTGCAIGTVTQQPRNFAHRLAGALIGNAVHRDDSDTIGFTTPSAQACSLRKSVSASGAPAVPAAGWSELESGGGGHHRCASGVDSGDDLFGVDALQVDAAPRGAMRKEMTDDNISSVSAGMPTPG